MGSFISTPEILLNDENITEVCHVIIKDKMIEIKDDLRITDFIKTPHYFGKFFSIEDLPQLEYILEEKYLNIIVDILEKGDINIVELEKYIPKKYIPVIYMKSFFKEFFEKNFFETNFFERIFVGKRSVIDSKLVNELIENIKEEKITKDKLLSKGSYGEIYVDKTQTKVIKTIKYIDEQRKSPYTEEQLNALKINFFVENITTIILYCMHINIIANIWMNIHFFIKRIHLYLIIILVETLRMEQILLTRMQLLMVLILFISFLGLLI
jgi:hypothetical protein